MQYRIFWFSAILSLLLLGSGAAAFTVSSVSIQPEIMNPGDTVNVSCTVYAAYGTAFSAYDDLQLVTGLDDPVWSYTVLVNEVRNTRPDDRGKMLTIGGYELSYRNQDEVVVKVGLRGVVPAAAIAGSNISVLKIQELDARSNVITTSVIETSHRVGLPTPTPTPAFGGIAITSEPAGADVYLDNTIRGITPVTLTGVANGDHALLLRLDGYEDYRRTLAVTGDTPVVHAVLSSRTGAAATAATATGTKVPDQAAGTATPATPAGTGTLSVTTAPAGALVLIDGQVKGITPATIPGLSPGSHTIRIILDGYQDLETTTEITAGTTSEFITGLAKRKQAPGFAALLVLAAVGTILIGRQIRGRNR